MSSSTILLVLIFFYPLDGCYLRYLLVKEIDIRLLLQAKNIEIFYIVGLYYYLKNNLWCNPINIIEDYIKLRPMVFPVLGSPRIFISCGWFITLDFVGLFYCLFVCDTHLILITQRGKEFCFHLICNYLYDFFSKQSGIKALVFVFFITCVIEIEESSACMIKLKSWNYGIWKSRVEYLLYVKDLHELIKGEDSKLIDLDDKKWA